MIKSYTLVFFNITLDLLVGLFCLKTPKYRNVHMSRDLYLDHSVWHLANFRTDHKAGSGRIRPDPAKKVAEYAENE